MKDDFTQVVAAHARERPDHPAFIFGDRRLSYAELDQQVEAMARNLLALGLRPGDRVATLLPQSPAFAVTYLGAGRAGLVLVPLDARLRAGEMQALCERTRPKVLVTLASPEPLKQTVLALLASYPFEYVYSWLGTLDPSPARAYESLLARPEEGGPTPIPPGPDAPWVIIFTSGTTGRPKGALITHGNSWAMAEATVRQWEIGPTDVTLCNMPTSHVAGTHDQLAVQLLAGATGVLVPKFDPAQTLELLGRHGISYFGGVPTMFRLMFGRCDPRDHDTSSVRAVITAGEPASAELIAAIAAAFPSADVLASWGMTETAGFFTFTRPGDALDIVQRTEGKPDPAFEMKIVDASGHELPAGEVGEMWVRGACVIPAYMDPQDNEGVFVNGWLRTGDLGSLDEAGYLQFAGRAKEMFISGGYNVYPLEVESFLNACPGVNTSAVVAVPHELWGEVGIAFVLPEEGVELDPAEIERRCGEGLADYKRPARIVVERNLPRTLIGKIAKKELHGIVDRYL